ncbi:plasmolipin-like [Physella acuta]|uniref:plasmolipin-like n=1 Tax=Physella acuta TaxID=109671 RepID=UPI0027DEA9A4|nr:plasmolipin-like [Physella acuta]
MEQTTYEQTTEKRTGDSAIRPHPEYVRTVPGILKIAEIVVNILVLICASIDYWSPAGGGWVQFVAVTALITTLINFLMHFFDVYSKFSFQFNFVLFIYYCVIVVLYLIAAIVCAVRAPYWPAVGAAAFFAFVAVILYAVDTYLMYRMWQGGVHHTTAATATTTTTTTSYETRTQY